MAPKDKKTRRVVRLPPEKPKKSSGYDAEKDVIFHAFGDLNNEGTWIADIRSYDQAELKLCIHKVKRDGSVRTEGRIPLAEAAALYLALCAYVEDESGFAEFFGGEEDPSLGEGKVEEDEEEEGEDEDEEEEA